jgi:ferric-dicitrate binding protein FerR (iron transport regulator)
MGLKGFDREKLDRFFHGEYPDRDLSEAGKIFCDNNIEKELKNFLSEQFNKLPAEEGVEKKNLDHILYRIHYDINTRLSSQNPRSFDILIKWALRIAGILILPLVVFLGVQNHNAASLKKSTWVEIQSPPLMRAQFSLPDGTTGWLNSNSSVRYNGDFTHDRKVTLKGEAYFDVYKDAKRPFTVNTNEVQLKVLGTRFNVASYENEKNVEVVLEEGKLIFSDKEMIKTYTMNPNDLITYDKTTKDLAVEEMVQPQKYLSWTEGKLVFRNDPLDVVARRLERWYNIEVEIKGDVPKDLRLHATFINEELEEVMGLLKRSLPIDYKIVNFNLKPDETYEKKKVIITLKTKISK